MTKSVGLLNVRVLLKQYRSTLSLPVSPFIGGLEQEIARAHEQFLASVAISVSERDVVLTAQPGFSHFVIGLLYCIPAVLDSKLLHGIAGKLLNVKAVDDASGLEKCRTDDFAH